MCDIGALRPINLRFVCLGLSEGAGSTRVVNGGWLVTVQSVVVKAWYEFVA